MSRSRSQEGEGGSPGFEGLARRRGRLQAVMFDLDGTLIDSIPTYFRIAAAMLDQVGLPQAPREAVAAMIKEGLTGFHHLIPQSMADRREELIEACVQAGREVSARLYPDSVALIPGVRTLFHRVKGAGLRIGIVTASHTQFMERKLSPLRDAGIQDLVDAVIVLEDTMAKKPDPEPVTACARRLGVEQGRCAYVGDADVDMAAGKQAGTFTIGVLTGVDDHETLAANEPDLIVPGVRDLVPWF